MARVTRSPIKSKTTYTVVTTDSPGTIKHPLLREATVGKRRRWSSWHDWLSVALGVYFLLAPLWTPTAPVTLFVTLGAMVIAASVWAGSTASSTLAEFMKITLGAVIILSALFSAHTEERTAILTSWMVGAALIVLAVVAEYRNRAGRSATNPHDPHN